MQAENAGGDERFWGAVKGEIVGDASHEGDGALGELGLQGLV